MIRAYRLVKTKHAGNAFSGDGSHVSGGRWNAAGIPVVYTAESRALGALEILIGIELKDARELDYTIIPVEFDKALVEIIGKKTLPKDWKDYPPPHSTQMIGKKWARDNNSAILQVPSVIMPKEYNYVLNPNHEDFKKIKILKAETFTFDSRL